MGSLRLILHSRSPSCSCKRTILLSVNLCFFCSSMNYILQVELHLAGCEQTGLG